jgi:hypothetical protein
VEQKVNEPGAATFAIRMQYRGEERTTELPLTPNMIGQLALEAAFRNVSSSVNQPMKACRHSEEKNVWVRSAKMRRKVAFPTRVFF